jgi:exopolysaccharide biosynthesis polyprenyl glycosylphosphotransferase
MSEVEIATGAAGGHAASSPLQERVSAHYDRDALLRRFLAAADALALLLTAVVVGVLGSGSSAALLLVLSAPVWVVLAKIVGLYDRDQRTLRHLTVDEIPWLIVWSLAGTAVLTLLLAPLPALGLQSRDRLLLWGSALGLAFVLRGSARALFRRLAPPQGLLLVGEGPLADAVVRKLQLFPDIHSRIVNQVPSCNDLQAQLGDLHDIDRIVVACSELSEGLLEELLPICRSRGIKLTVVPPTRGMFGTATHLAHVADLPLLAYNTWYPSRSTLALKRGFDFLVALVGLVVALPVFALAAAAIVIDGGFPVFFRQTRAGQYAIPFRIYKFRTMVRNAEAMLPELVSFDELEAPMFKLKRDPRVTRVGRLLRRTSLDELPQLINVLYGDMSLVGPRPELLDLVERYEPEHEFRLRVKPGITGPWQVFGRSELTFDEVLAVEREYVENLSVARDVRILLMTLPAVIGRRGAF